MATPAILGDDLLAPISPNKPCGVDLRSTDDWNKIRKTRPDTNDPGNKGPYEKLDSADAGWPQLFAKTTTALKQRSKDLELALWLTEAATYIHGFAGLRDSLRVVRELLVKFWDDGLLPKMDENGVETRLNLLEKLIGKLPGLIIGIPLTARSDQGINYSYSYFLESRKPNATITPQQVDQAIRRTPDVQLENLLEDCRLAAVQFEEFQTVAQPMFGEDAPGFAGTKEAFETCRAFLEGSIELRRRETATKKPPAVETFSTATVTAAPRAQDASIEKVDGAVPDGSWEFAEELIRSGRVAEGLAEMTRLASTEPNGRARFHRKLLLVDICLSTQRIPLAKSILEELAELVDKHHLDEWETPDIAGGVWIRLYKCCKNEIAGTADSARAEKLFARLCRLDPWQALACNDNK